MLETDSALPLIGHLRHPDRRKTNRLPRDDAVSTIVSWSRRVPHFRFSKLQNSQMNTVKKRFFDLVRSLPRSFGFSPHLVAMIDRYLERRSDATRANERRELLAPVPSVRNAYRCRGGCCPRTAVPCAAPKELTCSVVSGRVGLRR